MQTKTIMPSVAHGHIVAGVKECECGRELALKLTVLYLSVTGGGLLRVVCIFTTTVRVDYSKVNIIIICKYLHKCKSLSY